MADVRIINSCRCAMRHGLADVQQFATKQEAQEEAELLLALMQEKFCKKHQFVLQERIGGYDLIIKAR